VEKAKQTDEPEKAKRKGSKAQWCPTVTLRRSSRNIDDGRPILQKAQEFKTKWNLEDNAGIKSKSQNNISKSLLISVAKDLDVVGVDRNPQLLDKMISLDRQRSLDNQVVFNANTCSASTNPGVRLEESDDNHGGKDLTPMKIVSNSLADPFETDQ
jgi:hypothetical protein